ncbi:hypothetical protein NLA96_004649, partial [Salmonella enterica]|nr:hypothetical protein [Salmonella enterica]EJK3921574.1 hypothetical protein [Salmonella enterica]
ATIRFTTTVAGTHSIAFTVPDSANAKAGAGTVNITFVAGPVDAAQSEVTVPVGAAVQGDPLELHLYARDANRNPVSAAQLDKVNVAIAATGTGVTLTATKTGDDTDATGPYRKYSLVPDTASYATKAIRYNTVTVQVDGANVGTQYHAAWSPDIDLDTQDVLRGPYNDVAGAIIAKCPSPFFAFNQGAVYTIGYASTIDERCGADPATGLHVRVKAKNTKELPRASMEWQATNNLVVKDWYAYGGTSDGDIRRSTPNGSVGRAFGIIRETTLVDSGTGTVTAGDWVLSGKPVVVSTRGGSNNPQNPNAFQGRLGLLDSSNKGKTSDDFSQLIDMTYTDTSGPSPVKYYPYSINTVYGVTLKKADAWFDRFTLSEIRFAWYTIRCPAVAINAGIPTGGWDGTAYTAGTWEAITDRHIATRYEGRGPGGYTLLSDPGAKLLNVVSTTPLVMGSHFCDLTTHNLGPGDQKDQNVVDSHRLKVKAFF